MIDRHGIALAIETALAARGVAVAFNDWNADFIVRLSGCVVGCASRYHPSARPGPAIAGRTVDDVAAAEADLAGRVIAAVDAFPHRQPPLLEPGARRGTGHEVPP